MRIISLFLGLPLLAMPSAASAEYLLNCRLIDAGHAIYRQHCKAEARYLVVTECSTSEICVVKIQNFKGAYSGADGLSADGIRITLRKALDPTTANAGDLVSRAVSNVTGSTSGVSSAAGMSVNTSAATGRMSQLGLRSLPGSNGPL